MQHPHESGRPPEQLGPGQFETSCAPALAADINRVGRAAAFILVQRRRGGVHQRRRKGSVVRHRLVGRGDEPVGKSVRPVAACGGARSRGASRSRRRAPLAPRPSASGGYIEAAAALFTDFEKVDHRTRIVNYERAMEKVYRANPADRETATFYALAVNQTALPSDKTYAQQLKAAAILEADLRSRCRIIQAPRTT